MYIPASNRIDDPEKAFDLLDAYGFATVVTTKDGVPWASHLPVLLDRGEAGSGVLRSHMARANEQWRHFDPGREVLCIFQGPHSYISPSWYASPVSVPTWNYATVHVYGYPSVEADPDGLRKIVDDTTEKYEKDFDKPWTMDLPDSTIDSMIKAIVGFRIKISRIEAKFKFGQNRSPEDQEAMLNALESSAQGDARALAAFIRAEKSRTEPGEVVNSEQRCRATLRDYYSRSCAKRSKALLVRCKSGRFKVITKQKLPSVACMSAKPLKGVDRSIMIVTGTEAASLRGRMAKRHVRSVHREACRPQGARSPQRQFSPVKSVDADDDGVNVPEVSTAANVIGEFEAGPSGFEAVACMQRRVIELGRPARLPEGVGPINYRKIGSMGGQESDPLIVLRDGRAVHMGKRRAGWIIEQRTHVSVLSTRSSRVTLPARRCCCASVQRSLMRENRT